MSFEEALARLEIVVKKLENGELSLEESLAEYAAGVALTRVCLAKLDNAERKLDALIIEDNGKIVEKPLALQEENDL